MKASLACAALVAAICIASHGLSAQQASRESGPAYQTPVTFGFALGAETPTGAFGHDATNGVGPTFDLVLQVPLSPRRLSVRGDLMVHNWFGPTGCLLSASSGGSGCGTNPLGHGMLSWSADIVARLNDPSKRWSPYAVAGAALYK